MSENLTAQLPEKLEIKKPMQGIVSSSMLILEGDVTYIKEGAKLYSAINGNVIGLTKSRLRFPFAPQKLIENLLKRKIHISSDKVLRGEGLDIPYNEMVKFFPLHSFMVFQNNA